MTLKLLNTAALTAVILAGSLTTASAHENDRTAPHAMDHAPIGVMGDHRHKKGEWMTSYRFMRMDMDGNRDGTNRLTPDEIATTIPNRFFGSPMQPPTLRVVPTNMTMDMHMVGAMYGVSDRVTLMGMTSYKRNEMDHLTYRGGMESDIRGEFTTVSKGFGDSSLTAIIGVDDGSKSTRQINANIGVSLPTGSNEKSDQILTPMGGTPSPRLPYPMQLGTGTYDLLPALTYFDREDKFGWGAQVRARLPLGENSEGYKLGTRGELTAWAAYEPAYWISLSGRLKAVSQNSIKGADATIMAPVQTADPDNFGGDYVDAIFGVNLAAQNGALEGHRMALELALPLRRDVNGPQLETDSVFTLGWQKAF